MAATVPVSKAGETSPLLEAAQAIGTSPDKSTQDKAAEGNPAEPAVGSFESFMGAFGRAMG